MLGAHGPRTMRLAAQHADIWSAFATESSLPEWFEPMLGRLDEAIKAEDYERAANLRDEIQRLEQQGAKKGGEKGKDSGK